MFRFLVLVASMVCSVVHAGTNEEGLKYLEDNKGNTGVVALPSGLQYKILQKGSGTHHPTVNSPCLCHYAGTLIDGSEFDSSYSRGEPTTFAPNQVIKGWTEAMQLMVEGDKFELYIPSELAYGDSGSGAKIPGGSMLIFTIEMIEIQGDKVIAITCAPDNLDDCNDKEKAFITKAASKFGDTTKVEAELTRLRKISGEKMKSDKLEWISRRINILDKMQSAEEKEL